jgi:hypothetical protein
MEIAGSGCAAYDFTTNYEACAPAQVFYIGRACPILHAKQRHGSQRNANPCHLTVRGPLTQNHRGQQDGACGVE